MDLQDLIAVQEAQGTDPRGRELALVVRAGDPEFGPYREYAFCELGGIVPRGYRMLTQEEVRSVLQDADYDRDA
jgi:hypothetical protein